MGGCKINGGLDAHTFQHIGKMHMPLLGVHHGLLDVRLTAYLSLIRVSLHALICGSGCSMVLLQTSRHECRKYSAIYRIRILAAQYVRLVFKVNPVCW